MKEALLKKRYGIPGALLLSLLAGIAVVAAGVGILHVTSEIEYPTHESLTVDLGDIPMGNSALDRAEGFIGIPGSSYDLTWTLSGDLDKFSMVNIAVYVDFNGDGNYLGPDYIGTLTKTNLSISRTHVRGLLETTAQYVVTATAEDDVACVGTSIVSKPATLDVSWSASRS